jgi:hypothetical protein
MERAGGAVTSEGIAMRSRARDGVPLILPWTKLTRHCEGGAGRRSGDVNALNAAMKGDDEDERGLLARGRGE